jgi:hypothetical protein
VGYAHRGRLQSLTFALLLLLCAPLTAAAVESSDLVKALETKRLTGDLDKMIARRQIRVLLVHSKTFYFIDRGRQRGATYDFMRLFEDDLNRRLKTGNLRVHVVFIPVGRDELI